MEACCGGIMGMGETEDDRDRARVRAARAGGRVDPGEFPRPAARHAAGRRAATVADGLPARAGMFRFVNPTRDIRVAGGREVNLRHLQPLALYPANSIFSDGYLTTPGAGLRGGSADDRGRRLSGCRAGSCGRDMAPDRTLSGDVTRTYGEELRELDAPTSGIRSRRTVRTLTTIRCMIVAGEGHYLIDADGRRYLDGVSSLWCNLFGHRRPEIDAGDPGPARPDRPRDVARERQRAGGRRWRERLVDIAPAGLDAGLLLGQRLDRGRGGAQDGAAVLAAADGERASSAPLRDARQRVSRRHGRVGLAGRHRPVPRRYRPCCSVQDAIALLLPLSARRAVDLRSGCSRGAGSRWPRRPRSPPIVLGAGHAGCRGNGGAARGLHAPRRARAGRSGRYPARFSTRWRRASAARASCSRAQGGRGPGPPLPREGADRRVPADGGDAHDGARSSRRSSASRAEGRTFFHGHTYTGNPLAAAAAHATLDIFEQTDSSPSSRAKMTRLEARSTNCGSLPVGGRHPAVRPRRRRRAGGGPGDETPPTRRRNGAA